MMSRRTLLKLAGGATAAGGAVAAGVYLTSEPSVAASGLNAEDVSIEAADGELQELTIAPTITVEWENYPSVHEIALKFRANGPQSNGTVINWTNQEVSSGRGRGGQSSGELEFDLETTHMLSKNNGPLDASSFQPDEGEEKESEVTVALDLRLLDDEGNSLETKTPILEVTYTVRVTHLEGEISVSGRLNTGAECISTDDSIWDDLKCSFN